MLEVEGPSQSLTFLGIVLDTQYMEARLLDDKLLWIRTQLAAWLGKKTGILWLLAHKQVYHTI